MTDFRKNIDGHRNQFLNLLVPIFETFRYTFIVRVLLFRAGWAFEKEVAVCLDAVSPQSLSSMLSSLCNCPLSLIIMRRFMAEPFNTRVIVNNTVDEKIQAMQEVKARVVGGALDDVKMNK